MLAALEVRAGIDLMLDDDALAVGFYRRDCVRLGRALMEEHATCWRERAEQFVFNVIVSDAEDLYEPRLPSALEGLTGSHDPEKRPQWQPKPKAKGKAKAKAKANTNK